MLESITEHLENISGGPNLSLKLVILIIMVKILFLLPKWLSGVTTEIVVAIEFLQVRGDENKASIPSTSKVWKAPVIQRAALL